MNDVPGTDLLGLRIRNTQNLQDKVVGISLRRRDQVKPDVVWGVLAKVVQNNSRFGLTDRLEVYLEHVMMPNGNGRVNTNGLTFDVKSAIKRIIFRLKVALSCWRMHLLSQWLELMVTQSTNYIDMVKASKHLLAFSWRFSVLI